MTPSDLTLLSKIFSSSDPASITQRLNELSPEDRINLARACYELTGKSIKTVWGQSVKDTFQRIYKNIGKMFFQRFPLINNKYESQPDHWGRRIKDLRRMKLFWEASDFDLLSIEADVESKNYKANEAFMSQYEEVDGVYFFEEPVNVYEHNSKIASITRNGIFGDDNCTTGELESPITAKPIRDSEAYFIPREKFVTLIRSIPGLQEKVFQDVVERARLTNVRAEEQRRLVQEILDNIGQGSFSIDNAGEIGENYTAIASDYLGVKNLAGVPFADIAFGNDRKILRDYYRALHMLFSGGEYEASMVLDLLPKEVTINDRIFKLHYSFVQDGTGNVMSVFVRMEDLTLERRLQQKEAAEKATLDKMQQNVGGFLDMLTDVTNTFNLINDFAEKYWDKEQQPDEEFVNQLMRTLHGSKGLSGQFELNKLKAVIHSMEDWFISIEKDGLQEHYDGFIELFQVFEQEYQFAQSFRENLGEGIVKVLEGISFTTEQFDKLLDAVREGDLDIIRPMVLEKTYSSAERIVSNWRKDSDRLADKLGKKVDFQLDIEDELKIPKEMARALNVGLGHLYRNCVDHGIEIPEKRTAAGKEEMGVLSVKMKRNEGFFMLNIADDGAGLDEEKIAEIAKSKSDLDQSLIDSYIEKGEYWKILFLPGFSSATEVTDVSGRGVGMDAVKATLDGFGGTIVMKSTPGQGSEFQISIPLES